MAETEDHEPKAGEVKFLGVVSTFNDKKGFGHISCPEAHAMWGTDIYAYKDVLASADAGVGDQVRFGIHVNSRGQPQASLPCFRVGEDGNALGVPADVVVVNAEEAAAIDPSFLERLKDKIERRSDHQNRRRGDKGPEKGSGKAPPMGKGDKGPMGGKGWDDGKGKGDMGWSGMPAMGWDGGKGWPGCKGWDGCFGGKGWDQGKAAKGWDFGKGPKGWPDAFGGNGWDGMMAAKGWGFEAKGWDGGKGPANGKGWESGQGWESGPDNGKAWDSGKAGKGFDDGKGWNGGKRPHGREDSSGMDDGSSAWGRDSSRSSMDRSASKWDAKGKPSSKWDDKDDYEDRKGSSGTGWGPSEPAEDFQGWGGGAKEDGSKNGHYGRPHSGGEWTSSKEVVLLVQGFSEDASARELRHIFRQYDGFRSLRMVSGDAAHVVFASSDGAYRAMDALQGYVFDEESYDGPSLSLEVMKQRRLG